MDNTVQLQLQPRMSGRRTLTLAGRSTRAKELEVTRCVIDEAAQLT